MGLLDLSKIDKRYTEKKNRKSFGGRFDKFNNRIKFLDNNNVPYITIEKGNVKSIIDGNGNEKTYMDKTNYENTSREIIDCCQKVLNCVKAFEKAHGTLHYQKAVTQFTNEMNVYEHVINGNRTVSLVDINHCYWRMLFNSNIITEEVYEEYVDKRDCRLVAVGNLNKVSIITKKVDGKPEKQVLKNKHEWAWHYVVYKTFQAVSGVKELINNNIFSYNTDGIYMPDKYAEIAVEYLDNIGLASKIKRYEIMGISHYYTVLKNLDTKECKRANLGKIKMLRNILPNADSLIINI